MFCFVLLQKVALLVEIQNLYSDFEKHHFVSFYTVGSQMVVKNRNLILEGHFPVVQ